MSVLNNSGKVTRDSSRSEQPTEPVSEVPEVESLTTQAQESDKGDSPTITHRTVFSARGNADNTRTDVGVGEVVTFKGSTPGTWKASAGDPVTGDASKPFVWTAPSRATSVLFELTSGTQKAAEVMNVYEPASITFEKFRDLNFEAGVAGAGMNLYLHYHPLDVSFGNVLAKEVSGKATNRTGRFENEDIWHDSGDEFIPILPSNQGVGIDNAACKHQPDRWSERWGYEWTAGSYDFVIPNHFKVKTEADDAGKKFTDVTQTCTIEDGGRATISKGGASSEREPSLMKLHKPD
jgi:hypothetical protein